MVPYCRKLSGKCFALKMFGKNDQKFQKSQNHQVYYMGLDDAGRTSQLVEGQQLFKSSDFIAARSAGSNLVRPILV